MAGRVDPAAKSGDQAAAVMVRERVPEDVAAEVLSMMDGWDDPGQVLPSDLDHWMEKLEKARSKCRREIIPTTPRTTRRTD